MIVYQVHERWEEQELGIDTWYRNKKDALGHYSRVLRDYRRDWREFERACVNELRQYLSACEVDAPYSLISMRVYRGELIPDKAGVIDALGGRFDSWELVREANFDAMQEVSAGAWRRLREFTASLD